MKRWVLPAIFFALTVVPMASAGEKIFGYDNPAEPMFGNIPVNTETLDWERAGDIPARNALGIRPILLLDLLFFAEDPEVVGPCQPSMILRGDWRSRADSWLEKYGRYLTPEQVAGIAIDSEANNQCIKSETLQMLAQYLIWKGINRNLLGVGNGIALAGLELSPAFNQYLQSRSTGRSVSATGRGSAAFPQPLLPWFPPEIGWVAIFAYDYLDPQEPGYQAILRDLKSHLIGQKYLLVPKGFLFPREVGRISPEELGWGTVRFARYCETDSDCGGMVIFLAQTVDFSKVDGCSLLGTDQMPEKWPLDSLASQILLENEPIPFPGRHILKNIP